MKIKTCRSRERHCGGGGLKLVQVGDDLVLTGKNKKKFYKKTKEYNCGACELTEFPDVSGIPKETKILDLGSNKITEIPDSISELTNLEELNLYDNEINKISPEIGKLTKLTKIKLTKNNLTSVPQEIWNLKNLQGLFLDHNKLTYLPPEIGNLTNLRKLAVGNNELVFLPPEIGNLKRLYVLDISENPKLKTIPVELNNLPRKPEFFWANNNKYEWLDDSTVEKYDKELGDYPHPMPNQKWASANNEEDFYKQSETVNSIFGDKLNRDVATKIFGYMDTSRQTQILHSGKTGGRKTRRRKSRKSSRKSKRRHR